MIVCFKIGVFIKSKDCTFLDFIFLIRAYLWVHDAP